MIESRMARARTALEGTTSARSARSPSPLTEAAYALRRPSTSRCSRSRPGGPTATARPHGPRTRSSRSSRARSWTREARNGDRAPQAPPVRSRRAAAEPRVALEELDAGADDAEAKRDDSDDLKRRLAPTSTTTASVPPRPGGPRCAGRRAAREGALARLDDLERALEAAVEARGGEARRGRQLRRGAASGARARGRRPRDRDRRDVRPPRPRRRC